MTTARGKRSTDTPLCNWPTRLLCVIVTGLIVGQINPEILSAQDDTIRFRPHLLTVDANEGIDLADVDGDQKLDVIAGRNWFRAPEFAPRPLRTIEDWNGYVQSNGDFTWDVNGDGRIDVVAGSFLPTEVYWYENPGPAALELGQLWKQHLLVDTQLSQNEASFLHDLNSDGTPEWITNSWKKDNPLVVWQMVKDKLKNDPSNTQPEEGAPPTEFDALTMKKHVVGVDGNTHGMGFGDVNNDGREDILIATGWYERPVGDLWEKPWKFHADWEYLHASIPMLVRDLDDDGLNDIIWGKGHDYGLYWWQSKGVDRDGKFQFEQHTIDDRYSQPHVIHFADLDGDGRDELISGKRVRAHNGSDPGGSEVPCMYYYRWNSDSRSFSRFVIDEGHVGTGLQIRTGDLNEDGKTDIAVAGKDGTWILFNEGATPIKK